MAEENKEVRILSDKKYALSGTAIMSISQIVSNLPYSYKKQIENVLNVLATAEDISIEQPNSLPE